MKTLGRSISHYSILAALNSKYISDLYVSTDYEIKNEAKKFDIQIIDRPDDLCTDDVSLNNDLELVKEI